jgi:uncharacterized protein YqgV (UPF0045/DUF77 family)
LALKYTVKTKAVMDGDTEVAVVHGLSFNAIVGLVNLNRGAVEALFSQFQGKDANALSESDINAVGMDLIESAPVFVAQIIAAATDAYDGYSAVEGEPSPLETILEMPLGLQLAFLQEIGELTFNAGGGAKKVLALVMKAVQGGSQSAK